MYYVPIFQVLKLFQAVYFNDILMAFRCLVLVSDTAGVITSCLTSCLRKLVSGLGWDLQQPDAYLDPGGANVVQEMSPRSGVAQR